jgi:hypothetical protein
VGGRAVRVGGEPASATRSSESRCIIALEIDNGRRMFDQCEEQRPYNPHGLKEMLVGLRRRTLSRR